MHIWIDASSPHAKLRVFGLTATERHLRSLLRAPIPPQRVVVDCSGRKPEDLGIPIALQRSIKLEFAHSSEPLPNRLQNFLSEAGDQPVMLLDGTVVADARLHAKLASQTEARVVRGQNGDPFVGIIYLPRATSIAGVAVAQTIDELGKAVTAGGKATEFQQSEFEGFIRNLRRSIPFYLFRVSSASKAEEIERFLFWSNYKGSTDLFTRYVYPPLVWLMVRPLARARVHPNVVTILSIILTFAAVPFFASGHFVIGFIFAYAMSVLDSVDGKLARLTFTDSPIGNILDHGLDVVHPPFWYLSWAFGLGLASQPWTSHLGIAAISIVAFYIADRLILKIYPTLFGRGFHTHSKFDARVRSIIARRNINLPIFLVGWVFGLGIEAFYLITVWQGLTALYHGLRIAWIVGIKREHRKIARSPVEVSTKQIM